VGGLSNYLEADVALASRTDCRSGDLGVFLAVCGLLEVDSYCRRKGWLRHSGGGEEGLFGSGHFRRGCRRGVGAG
jgi:hypothetical protein